MNKILTIFILFYYLFTKVFSQNTNIIQIIIVNYHGSRAPLSSYPTDPYGESYWSRYGGLGQITPRGLLQSYTLGQFVKNYYSNFLTPSYSPQRVHVRSVDSDPALVSTSAFLSGMFPPSNSDQLWSPTVSWFPIPIHSAESAKNPILVRECPKLDEIIKKSMNTSSFYDVQMKYMNFVKNISGFTASPEITLLNISHIFDNANSKLASNLPLELWLSDNLQNMTFINDYLLNLKYGTFEKARLVSGGVLLDIIKNIRNKMNGSRNEIHMYTLLDYQITSLMNLLNLNVSLSQIPFGTSLIFELRKDQKGLHYINLMLRNNNLTETTSLNQIKMNECDQLCNFGNFFDIVIRRTLNNISEECAVDEEIDSNVSYYKTTDPIFNYHTTPCPIYYTNLTNWTNETRVPLENRDEERRPQGELSRLELALIIAVFNFKQESSDQNTEEEPDSDNGNKENVEYNATASRSGELVQLVRQFVFSEE
ncbi:unnamed protein product [Brachionus calyciflorus]|uniref:2-phosphoxylose phosphatase 1 n=1 Tax=Brachionus calyciflorus TaxID=104777 RepID=A0A813RQC9_9BILA|nr:unnamed protein product [Brachionus calyciflorus]